MVILILNSAAWFTVMNERACLASDRDKTPACRGQGFRGKITDNV